MTLAGTSIALTVSGSLTFQATNFTRTYTGNTTFNATSTGKTVTTNGVAFGNAVIFDGVGGGWTLGSAFSSGGNVIQIVNGTFDTSSSGNYAVTASGIESNTTSARTINLNASTITLSGSINFATSTNLTFNAGTSQINITPNTVNINGGSGVSFYNIAFTNPFSGTTRSIAGSNTFNNLSFVGASTAGAVNVTFAANQTINGTLSATSTAGNQRVFFASSVYGIGFTLTVNSAPNLTDADFRDIYVIGTAAPISGTRIGNRGNNSGITFDAAKNVYWNLAGASSWWVNDGWCSSSGGTPSTDNFPLPQDTAIFDNSSAGTTMTIPAVNPYISGVSFASRTTAFTFNITGSTICYGSITFSSAITVSAANQITMSGGGIQTITSAGKNLNLLVVDTYGGTVQLADALNIGSNALTVTNGTFTTAGFAVTAAALNSSNSNVRAISFGASTVTLNTSGIGGVINFATTTNLTFSAGTSTVVLSNASTGGTSGTTPLNFYNLSLTSTSAIAARFTGSWTYNNFSVTPPATAGMSQVLFVNNQTINGTLTCAGASVVRRIFLQSNTVGTQQTLTVNSLSADDCDFRDIVLAGTASGSSPTRAGDCGNNSGITFPSPKTVYWNLAGTQNWSATGWATSSGGTPAVNNFPLAQDTAVFDNAGAAGTVTIDVAAWNIGTFDASARTSAMTFSTTTLSPLVYGNWLFGTGVIYVYLDGIIGVESIHHNYIGSINRKPIQRH